MKNLIFLNQINKRHKNQVGNKAFNLNKLYEASINVARFFVLTTKVYDQILKVSEFKILQSKIGLFCVNNLDNNSKTIATSLKDIRLYTEQQSSPKRIEKEISQAQTRLKTTKFAIRSSANLEDGKNSSFAGLFDTYLAVSKDDVLKSIKKCWASVFTMQVLTYCLYQGFDFSQIKMAVIVQKMIKADKGGVIFTKNIFDQKANQIVIEAAKGLGEKVVSGLVNPQRLVFDKKNGKCISRQIGFKKQVLDIYEAKNLLKIALKIEKIFGQPQDIEWAIEKGKIYILQSRPLT